MGEAWSDYYALDYLVTKGLLTDTSTPGQLLEGKYVAAGLHTVRTMAIDCPPGAKTAGCTSGFDGKQGRLHLRRLRRRSSVAGPRCTARGEIWGQTLWDLRTSLGHTVADTLITRAMSLSPAEPSFLDMRNAILQADIIAYDQSHTPKIWKVFAARGMGYFAAATDGTDAAPAEDFHRPPAATTPRTSFSGTVTDPSTGDPVGGALVQIAGLGDQFHAVTNDGGQYTIQNVLPGVYPKVVASAAGYLPDTESVDARTDTPADFSITRDWAASSGGARIVDFTGPDFSPECGPDKAIDTNEGLGWGSVTGQFGEPTNSFIPKYIVVDLKRPIDIDKFEVNPSNTCGDAGSASTGAYKIETSTDGLTFNEAASGDFTGQPRALQDVIPSGNTSGVRYVKFWIMGNQVPDFATNCPDGNFSGCSVHRHDGAGGRRIAQPLIVDHTEGPDHAVRALRVGWVRVRPTPRPRSSGATRSRASSRRARRARARTAGGSRRPGTSYRGVVGKRWCREANGAAQAPLPPVSFSRSAWSASSEASEPPVSLSSATASVPEE